MTNEENIVSECHHTWIIDSPNGPTSRGVCKECGEKAEFRNSIPISGWDRESSHRRRARQARK